MDNLPVNVGIDLTYLFNEQIRKSTNGMSLAEFMSLPKRERITHIKKVMGKLEYTVRDIFDV